MKPERYVSIEQPAASRNKIKSHQLPHKQPLAKVRRKNIYTGIHQPHIDYGSTQMI
jgi:hypothetical protein